MAMHVGFSDPDGPKRGRILPYVLFWLVAAASFAFGWEAGIFGVVFALLATNLFGLLPRPSGALRPATLTCDAGAITITGTRRRDQRIVAKEITGATTARNAAGVLVTLQHAGRRHPISIQLADDEAAGRVRHALGIGHGGFGTVAWVTGADTGERTARLGRLLGTLGAVVVGIVACVSPAAAAAVALVLGQFIGIGTLLGLGEVLRDRVTPSLVMHAEGLRLNTGRGWFALPYGTVSRVDDVGSGFAFAVPPPHGRVDVPIASRLLGGPDEPERQLLLDQVRAAAQRAHGYGPTKQDVGAGVEMLRRNGASPRDWLARLDMAGQTLRAGPGYRGHGVDLEDLWLLLEDPEADAELRTAAARVLRHAAAPETKVRIDAAVAAVRDENVGKRLRVALDEDLDAASRELAFLDATEPSNRWATLGPMPVPMPVRR